MADLAEVVRCYGLRTWVEQGYKQVKQELGWADFQVRSDLAIRRHLAMVCCAFSLAWWEWFTPPPPGPSSSTAGPDRREQGPETKATPDTTAIPSWPRALRRIRSWLTPAIQLSRLWRAWSTVSPPPEFQALITAVTTGHGINLYLSPV